MKSWVVAARKAFGDMLCHDCVSAIISANKSIFSVDALLSNAFTLTHIPRRRRASIQIVNGKRIFNAFALFLRLKKRQYVVEWVARDV